ncbi:hypothetical protein ACFLS9_06520 [Bacteroidota bacterium]
MKASLTNVFLVLFCLTIQSNVVIGQISSNWYAYEGDNYRLFYSDKDTSDIWQFLAYFDNGIATIQKHFKKSFRDIFNVYIHPDRVSLDAQWSNDWNMPGFKSECWMVGSGVANQFDLLSPRVWNELACEHDPADTLEIQKLITHELMHVYHGQINGHHFFEDMTELNWLIEGTAVYISGQFDDKRIFRLKEALNKEKTLDSLNTAWQGDYRYAVCGSMSAYISETYDIEIVYELLTFQTNSDVLNKLNLTEVQFLTEWKKYVEKL